MIDRARAEALLYSFSALQRAENSSIEVDGTAVNLVTRFSALQRAENSSMNACGADRREPRCFSALQRAENSSMTMKTLLLGNEVNVSVLFSEPKIPQSATPQYQRAC